MLAHHTDKQEETNKQTKNLKIYISYFSIATSSAHIPRVGLFISSEYKRQTILKTTHIIAVSEGTGFSLL